MIFDCMLLWAINMNRFWVRFVQQWYTKIGTFIPYRLGHIENIFWTLVKGLFICWTCSSFAMLPTTRFVLSSTRLVLGRAPTLQLCPMVNSRLQAFLRQGLWLYFQISEAWQQGIPPPYWPPLRSSDISEYWIFRDIVILDGITNQIG